jgi:CheY-like chemotaxis protein
MPLVLIIDDSRYQRVELRRTLDNAGFEVLEAADGESGLALAGEAYPDLILVDLLMPGMGGLEVMETLQEQGSRSPVIVLTSGVQEAVLQRCLEAGAAAVLVKPATKEELLSTLRNVLQSN